MHANIAKTYDFKAPMDPPCSPEVSTGASIYVLDCLKLVFEVGEADAQSQKCHVHWNAVCPDLMVSFTSITKDVLPVMVGSFTVKSGIEWISGADDELAKIDYTASKILVLDGVLPM